MTIRGFPLLLATLAAGLPLAPALSPAALAQPADLPIPPARTSDYPPGVKVARAPIGPVYVDRQGRTLYGMDMRTLLRFGADPAQYCTGLCAEAWEPLLAPAGAVPNIRYPGDYGGRLFARLRPDAAPANRAPAEQSATFHEPQKAPDWTIIQGPQGPQWVYKGWHVVYTRRGEARHSAAHDGAEGMVWNALRFVPPVPEIVAPTNVTTRFVAGAHVLADKDGRLLYSGKCRSGCAEWRPFGAGLASLPVGQWTVLTSGDAPQWSWRGKPVFVSADGEASSLPAAATLLKP